MNFEKISLVGLAALAYGGWLWSVPGLHYDEAWFMDQAINILQISDYWPVRGMSPQTFPVFSYLLALNSLLFGPSLESTRIFFFVLNLINFLLLMNLLERLWGWRVARNGLCLWVFLPVAVFGLRLQIEVTSWFLFSLLLIFYGLVFFSSRRGPLLIVLGATLGMASHVLFFVPLFGIFWWVLRSAPSQFRATRTRILFLLSFGGAVWIPIRLGVSSGRILPFLLAGVLVILPLSSWHPRFPFLSSRRLAQVGRALPWLGIPVIAFWGSFEWTGLWPYAQAGAGLGWVWFPMGELLFFLLLGFALRHSSFEDPFLQSVSAMFLLTALSVPKPVSSRYWLVPALALVVWIGIQFSKDPVSKKWMRWVVPLNGIWAFWIWSAGYIYPITTQGASIESFRVGPYSDAATDYRPVYRVFRYLEQKNCHMNEFSIDHGRLFHVMKLLRKASVFGRTQEEIRSLQQTCLLGGAKFYIGQPQKAPKGFRRLAPEKSKQMGWGDLELWYQSRTSF